MRQIEIVNKSNPLPDRITAGYCSSFFCRLLGLMFRRSIPRDWGLLLVQGTESIVNSAIHMFAVPFDLAVIWLDRDLVVVDKALVTRWIGIKSPRQAAKYILELHPEQLDRFNLNDRILFNEIEAS